MDLKWAAVALIFVVATLIYARTMRVHAHASWGEIIFPWLRERAKSKQRGRATPAE
jgi:hypothetical protein